MPPEVPRGGLRLTPDDFLRFRFEMRRQIPTTLTLTNVGSTSVAFKVKTTSPKKYCVRPNTGVVPPGGTTEVQVIMQQHKEWPADFNNCKDKFLVQSMPVDSVTSDALLKLTKDYTELFAQAPAGTVSDFKLRVQLIQPAPPPSPVPEEADGAAAREDTFADTSASPATFSSPAAQVPAAPAAAARSEPPSSRQLAVETMEKNAAIADRARLQKELAETRQKYDSLKGDLSLGKRSSAIPFTLLHLLLTAILAFCLGRFT